MAYNITLNTVYNPLSYQELLDPIQKATESHKEVEKNYGNLQAEAGRLARFTNQTKDPYSYSLYSNYAKDLNKAAESLMRQGLTPATNPNFLTLKSRYNTDIFPIEIAYKKREALAEEQRKALAADPTLMYQRMANNMSLDDYVKNPQADYGASYSGSLLTKQVAQIASNIAKDLTYYGQGKPLDAFTSTFLQQHGWTAAQVQDALFNPNSKNKHITDALVNQVIQSSGIKGWADSPTLNRATEYAKQGLWDLIGGTQVQQFENYGARLAAQEAKEKRVAKAAAEAQANPNKDLGLMARDLKLDNLIVGDASRLEATKNTYNKLKKKGYITKDNRLTIAGQKRMEQLRRGAKDLGEDDTLLRSIMQRSGNSIYGLGARKVNKLIRTDIYNIDKDKDPQGMVGTQAQWYPIEASKEKDFYNRYVSPNIAKNSIKAIKSLHYNPDGTVSFIYDHKGLAKKNIKEFFGIDKNGNRDVTITNIIDVPGTGETILSLSNGAFIKAPKDMRSESARSRIDNFYSQIRIANDQINNPSKYSAETIKNAIKSKMNAYNSIRSINSETFAKYSVAPVKLAGYYQFSEQ